MPNDITMCHGGECILKDNCLRFTGTAYGRQDFFGSLPFNNETKTCEHYKDDRPDEKQVQEHAYYLWQNEGCPKQGDLEFWFRAKEELLLRIRDFSF